MGFVVVGLSHKTAPLELREHLTIPKSRLKGALDHLKTKGELKESVVLSTCNRLEIYARPEKNRQEAFSAINQFFQDVYGKHDFKRALVQRGGFDAVEHLLRVASGLESMVLGETEILGQVKSAYQFSKDYGSTGKVTNVLFQRALFVGKKVRARTDISEGGSSIGNVAVQLAHKIFGSLDNHRILLIGAGKISEVTARHLLSQKAGEVTVLNRTFSNAGKLAKLLNGRAVSFERMREEIERTDIVICSTSSDKPLIQKEMVEAVMPRRRQRSLYFIDIAVPRNVDPAVHRLDNVYVYNIDDLKGLVEENLNRRRSSIESAEAYVKEKAVELYDWTGAALQGKTHPLRHNVDQPAPQSK